MKKQLMIASAALLLGTFACKKNETTPPLQPQGLEASSTNNSIVQKMYEIDTELTTELIKKFKKQNANSLNFRSSDNSNSLALDSSIWLLEAALNYDFDTPKTIEELYNDSLTVTIETNNGTVNSSDFSSIFLSLKNEIAQKIGSNKICVIDVQAELIGSEITYKLNIKSFTSNNAQKVMGACDPFTTETASPSRYATVMPSYTNYFLSCSGNPTLDGPSAVESKLNGCMVPSCPGGVYYTNVTTSQFSGINFPSRLYYRTMATTSDFCLSSNKILSAADLNQYKAGSSYLANLYKPAGKVILHTYDISLLISGTLCTPCPAYYANWVLNVQYGTINCGSGGGGSRTVK